MNRNKYLTAIILFFLAFGFHPMFAQPTHKLINFSEHKYIRRYASRKMKHPEFFQGNKERKNYFEGWYFKMVSANGSSIMSVIPGISLSEDGKEQHAFIQLIDGISAQTSYYTFPIEEFFFSKDEFAIRIGNNYFSENKLILNIQTDSSIISGEIEMNKQVKLPSKALFNAGIMGWYRFMPFMECYHGVVSLNHELAGTIFKDGKKLNFNNGGGYIEKDWGSSMPSAWIWMQSNHFSQKNCSFMLSVADVPWIGKSFTGFLGFFLHDNIIYRFATYTHAKLTLEEATPNSTKITIKDRKNTYKIKAFRNQSGELKAPVNGSMDRRIAECVDVQIHLTILDKKGTILFCDSTSIAGLELVGDQNKLIRNK
jgi:tocopherol cyclase